MPFLTRSWILFFSFAFFSAIRRFILWMAFFIRLEHLFENSSFEMLKMYLITVNTLISHYAHEPQQQQRLTHIVECRQSNSMSSLLLNTMFTSLYQKYIYSQKLCKQTISNRFSLSSRWFNCFSLIFFSHSQFHCSLSSMPSIGMFPLIFVVVFAGVEKNVPIHLTEFIPSLMPGSNCK